MPKPILINFTQSEILQACAVASAIKSCAIVQCRSYPGSRKDFGLDNHMVGLLGEKALAKWLKIDYTPTIGGLDTHTGDVAGLYQVKAIR